MANIDPALQQLILNGKYPDHQPYLVVHDMNGLINQDSQYEKGEILA